MATKVIMPKSGMAMEEGILVAWLKKVGDRIVLGEAIAEIETDKAIMELQAEVEGTLIAVVRGAGDHVPVTETIAWIGEAGEKPPEGGPEMAAGAPHATSSPDKVAATPAARRLAAEAGIELRSIPAAAGSPLVAEDVIRHIRRDATPLASRMAQASGIDLGPLARDGAGRVRGSDVAAAIDQAAAGKPESARRAQPGILREDRRLPFTAIQKITGQRLSRSHSEIPSVTIFIVADATSLLEARERINASGAIKVSLNDLAVRACAKALVDNPRANAVVDGDGLILKGGVNIGLAVATEAGLQVPTLRDADRLSLAEQSIRSRDLADRARSRRLRPDEFEDGTFTVSNIGMYGVLSVG